MKKLFLAALALIALETTEAPFRKIFAEFWFVPEEVKAQQCKTVSRYLSEDQGRIWRDAAENRITYWLENESGCSTPKECNQCLQRIQSWVEQKVHPDGNILDQDVLKKWKDSDYCLNLVASYRSKLEKSDQTTQFTISSTKESAIRESAIVINSERKAKDISDQALKDFEETTNSIKRLILDEFKQYYDSNKLNTEFRLLAEAYPKEVVKIEIAKIEDRTPGHEDVSKNKMDIMLKDQKSLFELIKRLNYKYYHSMYNNIDELDQFYISQGMDRVGIATTQLEEAQRSLKFLEAEMVRLHESINTIALNDSQYI